MSSDLTCRICGCTEDDACVIDGEPCGWVERDLCSGCVDAADAQDAAFFAESFARMPVEPEPGFQQDERTGLWLPLGAV